METKEPIEIDRHFYVTAKHPALLEAFKKVVEEDGWMYDSGKGMCQYIAEPNYVINHYGIDWKLLGKHTNWKKTNEYLTLEFISYNLFPVFKLVASPEERCTVIDLEIDWKTAVEMSQKALITCKSTYEQEKRDIANYERFTLIYGEPKSLF